mgnify:CR=1 FL=1
MKQGDLVTVLTPHGEFVGRLEKNDDTGVHLSNPKMMVSTKEGNMGFARGVAVTGEENPETVTFMNPVYIIPTNEQVSKAHTEATTNIQLVK